MLELKPKLMPPLIDFHNHHWDHAVTHGDPQINQFSITSLDYSEYLRGYTEKCFGLWEQGRFCSVGLHPWYLHHNIENLNLTNSHLNSSNLTNFNYPDSQSLGQLEQIMQHLWHIAQDERVIAIGECGLDRHIERKQHSQESSLNTAPIIANFANLSSQTIAFSAQIELSETLQKPLIIHCVKAFNELIALKQKHRPRMPWLVHGFDKKDDLRRSLAHHGINISFGASIFQPRSPSRQVSAVMPLEKLFLETDAQTKFTISEIYREVALIRQMPLEILQEQLWQNFQRYFQH